MKINFELCGGMFGKTIKTISVEAPSINTAYLKLAMEHDLTDISSIYIYIEKEHEEDE